MNSNFIYLAATALAIVIFVLMYKDEKLGPKYAATAKKFIMLIVISAISYIYNPQIGLLIGFTSAYTGLTNFDKDFTGRFILESTKVIIMQLLIGVAAYLCSFNKVVTVLVSVIVIFTMYYVFTHKGKASRVRGFLLTYILVISQKIPRAHFSEVFSVLFISIVLSIAFYYFFTRDKYYKNNRFLDLNHLKKITKLPSIFVEEDTDEEFKRDKFRHAIISTVLMTGSIFYMLYYGNGESEWIIIVASAILVIDPVSSEKMIIDRTLGTIIGAIIFLVAHRFITDPAVIKILIFVSIFYFVFPMDYYKRMVFITYFVLEVHLMISNYTPKFLVTYRIGFTIIAAIIVSLLLVIDNRIKILQRKKKQ
ncbi:MAG: FUSC family protein [Sarcina sp.]